MPPRRRIEIQYIDIKSSLACRFMTNQMFDLKQKCKVVEECAICLEKINTLNEYCLLSCGHSFHYRCYIESEELVCAVCRQ